jgi:DsbC/DsbD-like thiol-disulfide interchange protein
MTRAFAVTVSLTVAVLLAVLPGSASGQKWYEKAVKRVEGSFTPAEAKPGQTVTFKLTVELNEGYHTYPTVQPDKMAAGMQNVIKFPQPGTVVFVGKLQDPKDYLTKEEPDLGIREIRYNTGTVTYTRKAVVSPKAAAGAATVKLAAFTLSVCDKNNCFPPKQVPVEAALKVLDGPPVPVEKEFAAEVAKALEGK